MKELVTVVIPCFKQAQYLQEAIDSVLAQTYPYWECFIVNDASPDDTAVIADAAAAADTRIHVIHKSINEGLAAARNSGIKAGNGTYILPLDADDKLASNYLERTLSVIAANEKLKLVYTDTLCFGFTNEIFKKPEMNISKLLNQNFINCTALYRRRDYEETSGYRKNVFAYEDWDFWLQLITDDSEAQRIPEPLFICRTKESSMIFELTNNSEREKEIRKSLYYNNKQRLKHHAPELFRYYFPNFYQKLKRKLSTKMSKLFSR